jgi:putative ABC transport system permease protein
MPDTILRDLRIGARVLIKDRSFSALAIVVLALGICGVTTMFSVVNGVMLRGFSFPTAKRLASINFIDPSTRTFAGVNGQIFAEDFEDFRTSQKSFERLAAYINGSTVNMTVNGQPRRYTGAYVSEQFLRCLGVTPMMGRDFTAADNVPGGPKIALIGYGIWQRDFGGSSDVVGTAVRINGEAATIIGVMPKGFAFPTNEELWIPIDTEFPPKPRTDPAGVNPAVLGVLKAGVSFDQATAEFTAIAKRLATAYPDTNKHFDTADIEPLIDSFTGPSLRATLWTMLGFCVGVLLIACVNVMNMQFARATLRAKELAIRSSLGATRGRLVRQMLTESLLLSALGAGVGIALAYGATGWLSAAVHNMDSPPPAWMTFDVDAVALAVTVGAAIAAAVVSSLLPAWMASRANAAAVLREGGRGNTNRRVSFISRGLVVGQILVTCILLIGALLQAQSILNQQTVNYGYDTTGLMTARMGLMEGAYPTPESRKVFYDRLLLGLRQDPAFAAVALTSRFRMLFSGNSPIEVDGRTYATDKDRPRTNFEQVTPGFFEVTGQKLLEGRRFTDQDGDDRQAVAIVNAAFAERHFGRQSAVGRRFRSTNADGSNSGPWRTIVGVVSTVRMLGPFNNPGVDESGYYVPFDANPVGPLTPEPFSPQFATLVVQPRAGAPVEPLASALRRDVHKVDADLPLYFVGTPKSQIDATVAGSRIIATMFTIFGVVAMVLAAVGIYGVMSFAVNQRRQEFGVRMALGANTNRILRGVLTQGGVQVGLGLLLGLGLTLGLATLMADGIQTTLFNVSPRDPAAYIEVGLLVTIVSLVATLVPARRAMRVDPITALRAE